MLIEDVACPVDKLGDMTQDLVDMFQKFGYKDASCFGHALEGNLHLVFSQVWSLTCFPDTSLPACVSSMMLWPQVSSYPTLDCFFYEMWGNSREVGGFLFDAKAACV